MTDDNLTKRPTIQEIARISGLSTATVDRVLNQRPGVRENTRLRVEEAIRKSMAQRGTAAIKKVAFVIEAGSSFIGLVKTALERVKIRYPQIAATFDSVPNFQREARAFCQLLSERADDSDAIVLVSREEVLVNSVVRDAGARGVPVICLTSDLPHSAAYVGADEVSAGANAAWFMGRMLAVQPAKVLFVTSASYRTQEEREMGFRRVMRTEFPHLDVHEKLSSNDESEETYQLMKHYLRQNPDVAGVYNLAGGNRGIARALNEAGLTGKVIFIGHELTEHSRKLLERGEMDIVFAHDMDREVAACIQLIEKISRGEPVETANIMPLLVFTKYSRFELPTKTD